MNQASSLYSYTRDETALILLTVLAVAFIVIRTSTNNLASDYLYLKV